jgi:hypothetical protein
LEIIMNTEKKTQLSREIRRQKALERLGSNSPRCVNCSNDNPACLEKHHIAGRGYHHDCTIMCRNCHRTLSDWQKDHPPHRPEPPHQLEIIGRFLLGVADLFELLIRRLKEFGQKLIALAGEASSAKGVRP